MATATKSDLMVLDSPLECHIINPEIGRGAAKSTKTQARRSPILCAQEMRAHGAATGD